MPTHTTHIFTEPDKQEILITREFDAPRELVFRASTDPTLIPQWWGPRHLSTYVAKMDVRSAGQWRFINRDAEGNTYAFHGVYHEILAPERIITTFEFEGLPETGHVALETTKFEALPGDRTRLTIQSIFQSVADRDGMLHSGMETGINETHDRLAELLQKDDLFAATNQIDMKLELVPVPVSDIDRAKAFYIEKAAFELEVDVRPNDTMRVVQLTPPGSACTIVFGTGMGEISAMQPGSVKGLHLVVADIHATHAALVKRGLAISDIWDMQGVMYASFSDPDGNLWLLQAFPAHIRA
jgi:uncharacterized protein YndB with AHSA1/START domain/predicted enzyme related to lactoylglutathione lyase